MTIGELIDALRNCSAKAKVRFGFPGYQQPGKLLSYRGYCDQPAISYERCHYDDNDKSARDFADELEAALERVHYGWKGGEFRYTRDDVPYVANSGCVSDVIVSGLRDEGYQAIIEIEYRP